MSDKPWIKWFTSDFLNGVASANLKPDEIGIYAVCLSLMADRGGPIDDDRAWIARKAGTSTRHASMVINKLAGMPGKLKLRAGMIGNVRMLAEIKRRDGKSDKARAAAMARWNAADQPELDLAPRARARSGTEQDGEKSPIIPEIISEIKTDLKSQKRRKTAENPDADASRLAGAREESQRSDRISSQPNPSVGLATEPLDPLARILDAAGYFPKTQEARDRSARQVARWLEAAISLEATILPVIANALAQNPEPTRTLGRFENDIRTAHATGRASAKTPRSATPIFNPEGEAPEFETLRRTIHERMGNHAYCQYANPARFEALEGTNGDAILKVIERSGPSALRLMEDDRARIVRESAAKHGFPHVW